MTEYEVYSYEAFRKKYRDDVRPVERASVRALDLKKVAEYLERKKGDRPHLAATTEEQLFELTGITRDGEITITALMLFGVYPQAYYPQLGINATCVPGDEMGIVDGMGNRFTDTKRIEGTLSDMLDEALAFVRKNMRVATRIDPKTGRRVDIPQYPMDAVREAILNALVHRDYSFHTEGMPIQLIMYTDRLEIINPGGLYGRLTIDQLGNVQPDTRNPVLVTAMETLGKTENRYSGIPTIRYAMKKLSLPAPLFVDSRGKFAVTLYNTRTTADIALQETTAHYRDEKGLIDFCRVPRSRKEIVEHIAVSSGQYALRRYLEPLIQAKVILMTEPDKPRSSKQKYYTAENI